MLPVVAVDMLHPGVVHRTSEAAAGRALVADRGIAEIDPSWAADLEIAVQVPRVVRKEKNRENHQPRPRSRSFS